MCVRRFWVGGHAIFQAGEEPEGGAASVHGRPGDLPGRLSERDVQEGVGLGLHMDFKRGKTEVMAVPGS